MFVSDPGYKSQFLRTFGKYITLIAKIVNSVIAAIVAMVILATCNFQDNKLQVFYLAYAKIQFVFLLLFVVTEIGARC